MAEENVILLRVGTEEAVKSVQDLRDNIKELKQRINETQVDSEEGWKDYQKTLKELKENQNALKDAMYATSGTFEDVVASAKGATQSYNSLVHKMAELKTEWRATNEEARRNELGEQIAIINQQLKDMDASVGNFQRNVGNYESGVTGLVAKFDQWGATLKQMPPTLGSTKEAIGKVGETMQLVGKQPILGMIGLLAPIIIKITDSLKDNATAMDAIKKLMEAIQPVFDVLEGVLEKVAQGLSMAVEWLVKFVGQSDGIKKVMATLSGVGNAILQYLLAPIKSAVAAFKGLGKIIGDVFKGNWGDIKTHARETGEEIAEAYKEGFSFKSNFEEGREAGAKFIAGVKSAPNVEAAKEAGKEIGKAVQEGIDEEYEGFVEDDPWAEYERQQESLAQTNEWLSERLRLQEEAAQREIDMAKAVADANQQYWDEQRKAHKEMMKERVEQTMAVADATSGLLSSLADMYESDEKNAEKNAKKIKALRIASATIDMLNGAVGAYASAAASLPPPAGLIVGAASAASVIAMGMANINKIKSTSFSGSGSSASASAPSVVSAPSIDTNLQSVRNVTSASEEERLNRMASDQRVYILQSDIEASGKRSKVQVSEASF